MRVKLEIMKAGKKLHEGGLRSQRRLMLGLNALGLSRICRRVYRRLGRGVGADKRCDRTWTDAATTERWISQRTSLCMQACCVPKQVKFAHVRLRGHLRVQALQRKSTPGVDLDQ